jgi:SulP family sulfate permease
MPSQIRSRSAFDRVLHQLPRTFTLFSEKYGKPDFVRDVIAGLTVGIIALPLAMAFAIASGLPPERGLYTAIVAGFFTSLLSGSRYLIGGPTGAFVVIVFGIASRQGYAGLQAATLMAGVMLLLMGLFRFGAIIKFIPYPVVTGFTSGIALVIFSTQMRDFFGLQMAQVPAEFFQKWGAYLRDLHTFNPYALALAAGSLAVIVGFRRFMPRVPGPIVAVAAATAAAWAFDLPVDTIGSRFGEIPRTLPAPEWPEFSLERIRQLFPDALTIAMLSAIESLLCAVAADGMTGDRHRSNTELVGQGVSNILSSLFGGLPATGAIARTATSIKSGARSPVAGLIHAVTLLGIMVTAAPLASLIPLAVLAAILVVVAYNMSEIDHFRHMFRMPRSDALVMVVTFGLTVVVDLTLAVQVGVVLAALLFMRRMSEVTEVGAASLAGPDDGEADADDPDATRNKQVPPGVDVYEINGPFFFGVADRLKDELRNVQRPPKVFVVRMRRVPAIDATGMTALSELAEKCRRDGMWLVLSGVQAQPRRALERSGLDEIIGPENIHPHIDAALARAKDLIETMQYLDRGRAGAKRS